MTYRSLSLVPVGNVPEERRGSVGGRFCRDCGAVYPRFAARHAGRPIYGKDHISSPCSNEGKLFAAGADWWEDAVEMLPAADDETPSEQPGAA